MPSLPSVWTHSNRAYNLLREQSEDIPGIGRVWKGFLTQLIMGSEPEGLGLSNNYYSYITNALKQTGSIRQLKRGGGTSQSEWLILGKPEREQFDWKFNSERLNIKGTRTATKEDIFKKALDDLNSTVLDLRGRVELLEARVKE